MAPAPSRPSSIDRPLGATENLYWLLDKLYCLNFVVFAEVEGQLDSSKLTAALATVQAENPLLRARIATVRAQRWFQALPQALAPLQQLVLKLAHWRTEIERQLQLPFDTAHAPLARVIWFKGASRKSVLAMTYHHAIADCRLPMAGREPPCCSTRCAGPRARHGRSPPNQRSRRRRAWT
jgi:hypothetical protein